MSFQLPAPSGVTFNLLSTQAPLPLAPLNFAGASNGATGSFSQGMTAGVSQNLNILASKMQTVTQGGCGGFGVLNGLDLSAGTGLAGTWALDSMRDPRWQIQPCQVTA